MPTKYEHKARIAIDLSILEYNLVKAITVKPMSLNKINLVGRAGKDPEVKYFESGSQKCTFTMAVNRRTSNRDEPPDWFDLELWGKTAEIAANYVKKGSLIGITGALKFDRWQDRTTGEERSRPIVHVELLDLLGSKRDEGSAPSGGYDEEF
jgi:single-strand DNA-binding protein